MRLVRNVRFAARTQLALSTRCGHCAIQAGVFQSLSMSTQSLRLDLSPGASLLLAHIGEPSNNDLRVVVIEDSSHGAPVQTDVGLATPVRPSDLSRGYELTWWRYVAYGVRNESYFRPESSEKLGQGLFGTRSDTAFRGYVSTATFAADGRHQRLTSCADRVDGCGFP